MPLMGVCMSQADRVSHRHALTKIGLPAFLGFSLSFTDDLLERARYMQATTKTNKKRGFGENDWKSGHRTFIARVWRGAARGSKVRGESSMGPGRGRQKGKTQREALPLTHLSNHQGRLTALAEVRDVTEDLLCLVGEGFRRRVCVWEDEVGLDLVRGRLGRVGRTESSDPPGL